MAPRFMLRGRLLPVGLLGLSLIGLGCASAPATSPRGAVDAYAAALDAGRERDAYDLLSAETRAELSFEDFQKRLKQNPAEVKALVQSLSVPAGPAYVTATVTTRDGQSLLLVLENGAWRVDQSALDVYTQTSPQKALGSFVLALENKRYDVLLRFVPDDQQEGLDARILQEAWEGEQKLEMEQIGQGLRLALPTAAIELLGDRATMSYGAGATVELVREHGSWKIEDFK